MPLRARSQAPSAERVLDPPEEAAVVLVVAVRILAERLAELPRRARAAPRRAGAGRGRGRARGSCRAADPPGTACPAREAPGLCRVGCPPGSRPRSRRPGRGRRSSHRARPASSSARRPCGGRAPSRSMPGLRMHPHLDEEIAGGSAERARVPFAAHANALAVVDAGRNVDVDRALVQRPADALTGRARRLDRAAECPRTGDRCRCARTDRRRSGKPAARGRLRRTSRR